MLRQLMMFSVVGFSLLSSPAQSASITVLDENFNLTAGTGTTNVDQDFSFLLPKFNSALGTLNSIDIGLVVGAINSTVTLTNQQPNFNVAVFLNAITAVDHLSLTYAGGTLLSTQSGGTATSGGSTLPFGQPVDFSVQIPVTLDGPSVTDATTLADFVGLGSVDLMLATKRIAGSTVPGINSIEASYEGAPGSLVIAYDFTPMRSVPEPATWTMMLVGFCGLGFFAHRHRGSGSSRSLA